MPRKAQISKKRANAAALAGDKATAEQLKAEAKGEEEGGYEGRK